MNIPDLQHSHAIDAFRTARNHLLCSPLTDAQKQDVCDLENAMQELNTLYWEAVKK